MQVIVIKVIRRIIVIGLSFIFILGCNNMDPKEKALRGMFGEIIILPDELNSDTIGDMLYTHDLFEIGNQMKFVSIIDGSCHECLYKPHLIKGFLDSLCCLGVKVILMFENIDSEKEIISELDSLHWDFYIDVENTFVTKNNLPNYSQLSSFLLDSVNKIQVVGDPKGNRKLQAIYFDYIAKNIGLKK